MAIFGEADKLDRPPATDVDEEGCIMTKQKSCYRKNQAIYDDIAQQLAGYVVKIDIKKATCCGGPGLAIAWRPPTVIIEWDLY